jgi:hypothetical protein
MPVRYVPSKEGATARPAAVASDRAARRVVLRLALRLARLARDPGEPAWADKGAVFARSVEAWCRRARGGGR